VTQVYKLNNTAEVFLDNGRIMEALVLGLNFITCDGYMEREIFRIESLYMKGQE